MVKPGLLAKRKIIEFLFMVGTIVEHTVTMAIFMLGIYFINWLAIKLGLGSSYPVSLLRSISEYVLSGIYIVFVGAGLIFIIKMFKDLEV